MDHYTSLLEQFVKIPSISTDPLYAEAMEQAVQWLEQHFTSNGFQIQRFTSPETHPIVFAEYTHDASLPTLLIYGHYDVQPASLDDGWDHDPFTLVARKGRLYGRGAIDNKGQLLIHIATACELIKQKALAYNMKFFIEGDEETGNTRIASLIATHKNLLSCDAILISDGETARNRPTIEASLRGVFNATITYKTATTNLHSGLFGGAHPNAAHELMKLIGTVHSPEHGVAIAGFYDDVLPVRSEDRAHTSRLQTTPQQILDLTGGTALTCEPGFDFYTQVGLRPSLEVTGFKSGYSGEGYANIIPATAEVRMNIRLVANQNPEHVRDLLRHHIALHTPPYVTWEFTHTDLIPAIRLDVTQAFVTHISQLLATAYDEEPVYKFVGGSIPVVLFFKEILGVNPILVSLANEDCNMHGVHENFDVTLVEKGLAFSKALLSTPYTE